MSGYRKVGTIVLAVSQLFAMQTQAKAATSLDSVHVLTDRVLLKETELLKLNARVKLYSLPHSAWQARRWTGYAVANNTLTSIGALETAWGRFHWLHATKNANQTFFQNAAWLRVLSNAISVSGATIELTADGLSAWKEHKQKFDPSSTRRCAARLQQEIDELLNEREKALAVATCTGEQRQVLEKEGTALRDLRCSGTSEFARLSAQRTGARIGRNCGYILAWLSNFESGAGSYYGSIYAPGVHRVKSITRTRMGGVSGVTDIISGGLNMSAPLLTRAAAAMARHVAEKSTLRQLDDDKSAQLASFDRHAREFQEAVKDSPSLNVHAVILHSQALKTENEILSNHEVMQENEKKTSQSRFIESTLNATVSGGTKIANGVCGAVGAFQYTRDTRTRFVLSGAGSTVYGVGQAVSGSESLRNQLFHEYHSYEAKKNKTSTADTLHAQIEQLDQICDSLRKEHDGGAKFAATPNQSVQ